jgi:hypothetical protein
MMMDDDADAAVKGALEKILNNHDPDDVDNSPISHAMIRDLLMESVDDMTDPNHQSRCSETSFANHETSVSNHHDDPSTIALCQQLRGLPRRPFYEEISRRLQIIQQFKEYNGGSNKLDEELLCFLPASHFGLTEICTLNELIPPPPSKQPMDIDECTRWIQHAGDDGIYAILGCRRTIGTIQLSTPPSYLLPPTIPQLLDASRKLHKPHTKSSLTVAARALAKHAHRGTERFFGILKGSEAQKNEHADRVIQRLIDEAMWMNIHCFGGIDESNPVLEIRTYEGYGARWSGIWKSDILLPEDVEFRGFLEPQVCIVRRE